MPISAEDRQRQVPESLSSPYPIVAGWIDQKRERRLQDQLSGSQHTERRTDSHRWFRSIPDYTFARLNPSRFFSIDKQDQLTRRHHRAIIVVDFTTARRLLQCLAEPQAPPRE